jgi:hypothetical protein
MFGAATAPHPWIAFWGCFGGLVPFGADTVITAFGFAYQQTKQAGTLTGERSSGSAATLLLRISDPLGCLVHGEQVTAG